MSGDYIRDEDLARPAVTVKDFDEDDRPREKAAKYGVQSLTNSECLAIILRIGRPGNPITEICRNLMRSNDNKFLNLERMSDEQLQEVKGIGPVKVLEIRTVLEIMRRYAREKLGDRVKIHGPKDIYEYMRYKIANLPHEEMWAIFLDNANNVIGDMKVSEGSATATIHDNKKVLRQALLRGANGVILCHNHPSGTLRPSGPDNNITRSFSEAAKILELRFLDHLIVSTEGFYSYRDNGAL